MCDLSNDCTSPSCSRTKCMLSPAVCALFAFVYDLRIVFACGSRCVW